MQGTQISLSVGLVGVFLSLTIGILLGGISGYYGGKIDFAVQRAIEFVLSLPAIPIWLAMAAALPQDWPATTNYFMITLILSLTGWAQLARVVRGRFLSLRTEEFVMAARLDGVPERRIIFRHMLPSFASHIIASITLAIPAMILAETSLSVSSASACNHRLSPGACCCARRRTYAPSQRRPGCSLPAWPWSSP